MITPELIDLVKKSASFGEFEKTYQKSQTIELKSLVGSAYSLVAAAQVEQTGGLHVFVMSDRDQASYLCSDFYQLLDKERVLFFPTAYKRSIQFGAEDPSGIVQRTTALNSMLNFGNGYLVVCTYPEAVVEKVVGKKQLHDSTMRISVGDRLSIAFVSEALDEQAFERVDFVHEPGQYSVRGGIVDIFSFSTNRPYRLDFFGDEIESIRRFDTGSQLSVEKLEWVEVVPNLKSESLDVERVSFAEYAGKATYWIDDLDYLLKRINEIRTKILSQLDEPSQIDNKVTGRRAFLADTQEYKFLLKKDDATERVADAHVEFNTAHQPKFNKNFELLIEDLKARISGGYKSYILSTNKMQIERLTNIFYSLGQKETLFEAMPLTLSAGFVSHDLRLCVYTDHQLFDRYLRYKIRGELDKNEALTISELNSMKVGDYVTHIDHGVGQFGGLVRTTENGKMQEAIKLVYKDGDVLLVNVHALHRIAKYKDKDADAPRIYKLGSGAWQRMKSATKQAVKNMARELIALYSERKSGKGFAFSHDTFMQYELEASFMYEDTPDQMKTTQAIKKDMESPQPMDRLVCGDVGFGKTELAIRAAFKAASDSKQVAVLVPTTILSLQHYRSFTNRLKEFPVRVEHLSRARTAKETRQIKEDLKAGKIDILIGTQKILGKEVEFKSLGLLIVDEEQKFGVGSKERLRHLKVNVDTLTLTATPIPRTLQFSLMGARDLSVINTPPPNRQPVSTESHLFDEQIIKEAIEFELDRQGQVYVVHNRVEDIERIAGTIRRLCPKARVIVGHGQMNPQQLETVIMDFIYGEHDVLVATSIIENGIDIPNANTMIINNAQNFGLSDLHQLRGRVGRSNRKSYCYLLTPPDEMLNSDARRRLRAIEEFSDLGSGFNIAMQDLDIRGAGNLLGGEQSGFIADMGFETYQKIIQEAMEEMRTQEGIGGGEVDVDSQEPVPTANFISDSHIEVDTEALLPDSYVSQSVEKIRLYKELDSMTSESELHEFEVMLVDRFGAIPPQAVELLNVVRLRQWAIRLGFERVKVKNGLMIAQFISDQKSLYYKSPIFMSIVKYVTEKPKKFAFRQNGDRMAVTFRGVANVGAGVKDMEKMYISIT